MKHSKEDLGVKQVRKIIFNTVFFLFLFTWTVILWVTTIYKLDSDGRSFFTFFTNWNWTLQVLFFTVEFGALASGFRTLRIFNLSFFFWITHGTTWLVFWLVFFMIRDNADFFLQLSSLEGGPYPLRSE